MEKENIFFCGGEGKGRQYLEKEIFFIVKEKKSGEGKGEKVFEKK